MAKFTSACNVENSLLRDNGTGVAVGGTSAPGALLDVQFTSTATTGVVAGPAGVDHPQSRRRLVGVHLWGSILTPGRPAGTPRTSPAAIFASKFYVDHYGKGTLDSGYGVDRHGGEPGRRHDFERLWNLRAPVERFHGKDQQRVWSVRGRADEPREAARSRTTPGCISRNPSAVAGAYGLYSAGGKNYFGGNVGIGTTDPGGQAGSEWNGPVRWPGDFQVRADLPGPAR